MGLILKDEDIVENNNKRLYRNWGNFFTRQKLYTEASNYYTKYLEIDDNDPETYYHRSICYGNRSRSEDAYKDAEIALKLIPLRHDFNSQVSETLFECNDFENSRFELYNNMRKFEKSCKKDKLGNRLNIIHENYCQSLGNEYGKFVAYENVAKIFEKLKKIHDDKNKDKSLWKLLKEQDKCDVVSILEKEDKLLHPREMERRKLCYKNFTQHYLHKGAKDIQFLADLRNNNVLLLPQTTKSTKKLEALVNENYDSSYKFVKMLQARRPAYTKKYKTGRDQLIATRASENHILRIQEQTRRDIFNILKKLHTLREQGKLEQLSKLVDYTIREYIILKTSKVMPRKFKFINEVCNILALAYIDKFKMPDERFSMYGPMQQLQYLFNVSITTEKFYSQIDIFKYKSYITEQLAKEDIYINYKKRLNILENQLRFAIFPIEKCFIYYSCALSHLKQSAYDMCITMTHNLIIEANICKNTAWKMVGYHLICKTLLIQLRLERFQLTVLEAKKIASKIQDKRIYNLFKLSNEIITNVLELRG